MESKLAKFGRMVTASGAAAFAVVLATGMICALFDLRSPDGSPTIWIVPRGAELVPSLIVMIGGTLWWFGSRERIKHQ